MLLGRLSQTAEQERLAHTAGAVDGEQEPAPLVIDVKPQVVAEEGQLAFPSDETRLLPAAYEVLEGSGGVRHAAHLIMGKGCQ
ncbi:hypothetical protein GCM10018965_014390 [Nonomuraea roseola]